MNRVIFKVLLGGIILVSLGFVKLLPVSAFATATFGGMTFTPLFLDQGFMGHPVDLDFPDWGVRMQFGSEDIPAPGVLTLLTRTVATSSALGYSTFGREVELVWTTNAPYAPTTTRLTLSDPLCGSDATKHCVIEETYRGETIVHRPDQPVTGSATADVRLGSVSRLVEVDGWMTNGDASWYAYKHCLCAASPDFPKGTKVLVTRKDDPKKQVVVTINDWGPERDIFPERVIDLDKVAFSELASPGLGVIQVTVAPYLEDSKPTLTAKTFDSSSGTSKPESVDVIEGVQEDVADAGYGSTVGESVQDAQVHDVAETVEEEVIEWEF